MDPVVKVGLIAVLLVALLLVSRRVRLLRRYLRAKNALEAFCAEVGPEITEISTTQQRQAAQADPRMVRAEADFIAIANNYRTRNFYDAAACYFELGVIYNVQGRWFKATQSLDVSLSLIEKFMETPLQVFSRALDTTREVLSEHLEAARPYGGLSVPFSGRPPRSEMQRKVRALLRGIRL